MSRFAIVRRILLNGISKYFELPANIDDDDKADLSSFSIVNLDDGETGESFLDLISCNTSLKYQ